MQAFKPIVIAEVGCNHKGDMEVTHEMIKIAANYCKANVIKFQKRNIKELLTEKEYNSAHPNPINAYGESYGAHREFLEFNLDQHKQIKIWCEQENIIYSTSVWDLTSAKEMTSLNPQFLKIPSACNLDIKMLTWLCENYGGDIHLSLGMTTQKEEDQIVELFEQQNRLKSLVLYSCTSGYPVAFEDVCLYEIKRLKDKFSSSVKGIAFSGHHLGIAIDIGAITLGAEFVERHFTLNRTWRGTDHAASLEPDGFRKLVRDIQNVSLGLTYKPSDILAVEQPQRKKLKRNI